MGKPDSPALGSRAAELIDGRHSHHEPIDRITITNAEDRPVLGKVYGDENGAPAMPPYASQLLKDTRLEPEATRTFSWDVPKEGARAEIKLLYRLLPPPAAKRLGIEGPESEARPFATLVVP